MHSAGATLCYAAGIFGAHQSEMIPQYPKQRCISGYICFVFFAVDAECENSHGILVLAVLKLRKAVLQKNLYVSAVEGYCFKGISESGN
jgi:hypothetical protein